MTKNSNQLQPITSNLPVDQMDTQAFRRGKVRELLRLGYNASQISFILEAGVTAPDGSKVKIPSSVSTIKNDIAYIRQEDAATAETITLPEKRQEMVENLRYIHNQAMRQFLESKGAIKNSFLNTALNALAKIAELEGLKDDSKIDASISVETKVAKFADEAKKLDKDERDVIVATIRKVLRGRDLQGVGGSGVPSDTSGVPIQTGDDEGVSGQS